MERNYYSSLHIAEHYTHRRRLRRWHSDSGKCTAKVETLLHSLERAATGIGLHINAHKTEYMCFNQTGDISTLNGSSMKLVDKFTNLGTSVINQDWHGLAVNEGMDSYQ